MENIKLVNTVHWLSCIHNTKLIPSPSNCKVPYLDDGNEKNVPYV